MATPSAVSSSVLDAPCCYGCVVLTREAGVQLWSGWRAKPSTPVPMKQLCDTVSGMFKEDADGGQDSSFLDAGTFAAASTADKAYIVSVICHPQAPETEVLLKAREISHSVRLLFGNQIGMLAGRAPGELADLLSKTNLLQMLQISSEVDDEHEEPLPRAARRWLAATHGANRELHNFFVRKLASISPCQDAFDGFGDVPGYVCSFFVDVTEPGEVLLSHWGPESPGANSNRVSESGGSHTSGGGFFHSISKDLKMLFGGGGGGGGGNRRKSGGGAGGSSSTVRELLKQHKGSLWTMIMREARNLAKAKESGRLPRRYASAGPVGAGADGGTPTGATRSVATMDLVSFEPGLAVTIQLLHLQHYEAAFVCVYHTAAAAGAGAAGQQGGKGGAGRHSSASSVGSSSAGFHVRHGEEGVPPAIRDALARGCDDVRARFPLTRNEILRQVWPEIPLDYGDAGEEDGGDQGEEGEAAPSIGSAWGQAPGQGPQQQEVGGAAAGAGAGQMIRVDEAMIQSFHLEQSPREAVQQQHQQPHQQHPQQQSPQHQQHVGAQGGSAGQTWSQPQPQGHPHAQAGSSSSSPPQHHQQQQHRGSDSGSSEASSALDETAVHAFSGTTSNPTSPRSGATYPVLQSPQRPGSAAAAAAAAAAAMLMPTSVQVSTGPAALGPVTAGVSVSRGLPPGVQMMGHPGHHAPTAAAAAAAAGPPHQKPSGQQTGGGAGASGGGGLPPKAPQLNRRSSQEQSTQHSAHGPTLSAASMPGNAGPLQGASQQQAQRHSLPSVLSSIPQTQAPGPKPLSVLDQNAGGGHGAHGAGGTNGDGGQQKSTWRMGFDFQESLLESSPAPAKSSAAAAAVAAQPGPEQSPAPMQALMQHSPTPVKALEQQSPVAVVPQPQPEHPTSRRSSIEQPKVLPASGPAATQPTAAQPPFKPPPPLQLERLSLTAGTPPKAAAAVPAPEATAHPAMPVPSASPTLPPHLEQRRHTLGPSTVPRPPSEPPQGPGRRYPSPNASRRLSLGPPTQPRTGPPRPSSTQRRSSLGSGATAPGPPGQSGGSAHAANQASYLARLEAAAAQGRAAGSLAQGSSAAAGPSSRGPAGLPAAVSTLNIGPAGALGPASLGSWPSAQGPGAGLLPESVPAYLYSPAAGSTGAAGVAGVASAQPLEVYQLFNGAWYQLLSDGKWVACPAGPPGTGAGGSAGDGGAAKAAAERDRPRQSLSAASEQGQQQGAPSAAALAQDVAAQVWRNLQGYIQQHVYVPQPAATPAAHPFGGSTAWAAAAMQQPMQQAQAYPASMGMPMPGGMPYMQAMPYVWGNKGRGTGAMDPWSAVPSQQQHHLQPQQQELALSTSIVPAAASAYGSSAPTTIGGPSYFRGPTGDLYCCVNGQCYLVSSAFTAPALPPAL